MSPARVGSKPYTWVARANLHCDHGVPHFHGIAGPTGAGVPVFARRLQADAGFSGRESRKAIVYREFGAR
jgi:hypothetical protein